MSFTRFVQDSKNQHLIEDPVRMLLAYCEEYYETANATLKAHFDTFCTEMMNIQDKHSEEEPHKRFYILCLCCPQEWFVLGNYQNELQCAQILLLYLGSKRTHFLHIDYFASIKILNLNTQQPRVDHLSHYGIPQHILSCMAGNAQTLMRS